VNTVQHNFYVDDCLKSTPDACSSIRLSSQLTELLAKGGFHLTKWTSNSRDVIQAIPEKERSAVIKQCDISNLSMAPVVRALGGLWNIHSDLELRT
jgi:hypothetical protein